MENTKILLLGQMKGASVLPIGSSVVVGDILTSAIKGNNRFRPRYQKEFGVR